MLIRTFLVLRALERGWRNRFRTVGTLSVGSFKALCASLIVSVSPKYPLQRVHPNTALHYEHSIVVYHSKGSLKQAYKVSTKRVKPKRAKPKRVRRKRVRPKRVRPRKEAKLIKSLIKRIFAKAPHKMAYCKKNRYLIIDFTHQLQTCQR